MTYVQLHACTITIAQIPAQSSVIFYSKLFCQFVAIRYFPICSPCSLTVDTQFFHCGYTFDLQIIKCRTVATEKNFACRDMHSQDRTKASIMMRSHSKMRITHNRYDYFFVETQSKCIIVKLSIRKLGSLLVLT